MQRNLLYAPMVAISLAGFFSAVETATASEAQGAKSDQHQMRDKTTTNEAREPEEG